MAMGNTYYRNATVSGIGKVKAVRLSWEPVLLQDGNDDMDVEEIIKSYSVLMVDIEAREIAAPYTSLTTFTPGNSATMVITFHDLSGSSDAVLTMTGPIAVSFGDDGPWGEFGLARLRLRCTSYSLA